MFRFGESFFGVCFLEYGDEINDIDFFMGWFYVLFKFGVDFLVIKVGGFCYSFVYNFLEIGEMIGDIFFFIEIRLE